ncbi:hypothetical protein V6259_17190 [Marinomonas sp. TI.3.20]|uniref:hypothetical protein n=1 Tax=Marinomonas sp. TI.3.20 TaxID=3121296 RepID=UPI0031202CCE
MKEGDKGLYSALLEAGADSVKANSAADITLRLVELRNDTTFLKLAVLLIISLKVLGCFAIFSGG